MRSYSVGDIAPAPSGGPVIAVAPRMVLSRRAWCHQCKGSEWVGYHLRISGRGYRSVNFGWNGARLARGRAVVDLMQDHPDAYAWVVERLSLIDPFPSSLNMDSPLPLYDPSI